jgi:hypothetical protein
VAESLGRATLELTTDKRGFNRDLKQSERQAKNLDNRFKTVTRSLGGLLVAFGGFALVTRGLRAVINAANEQENAVTLLRAALISTNQLSQEYINTLQQQASALQQVTTFGDEAILGVQRQLIAFGATRDNIKQVTTAVLDLSVGMGTDVKAGALLLGKALAGEFGTLSRYGIIVGEAGTKSEKLAEALKQINERFGGQAVAQAATFQGSMSQLGNAFGDLLENIGELIKSDEGLGGFLRDLKFTIEEMTRFTSEEARLDRELVKLKERFTDLQTGATLFPAQAGEAERIADRMSVISKRLAEIKTTAATGGGVLGAEAVKQVEQINTAIGVLGGRISQIFQRGVAVSREELTRMASTLQTIEQRARMTFGTDIPADVQKSIQNTRNLTQQLAKASGINLGEITRELPTLLQQAEDGARGFGTVFLGSVDEGGAKIAQLGEGLIKVKGDFGRAEEKTIQLGEAAKQTDLPTTIEQWKDSAGGYGVIINEVTGKQISFNTSVQQSIDLFDELGRKRASMAEALKRQRLTTNNVE